MVCLVDEAKTLDTTNRIGTRGQLATLLVQVGRREEARAVLRDAIADARQ